MHRAAKLLILLVYVAYGVGLAGAIHETQHHSAHALNTHTQFVADDWLDSDCCELCHVLHTAQAIEAPRLAVVSFVGLAVEFVPAGQTQFVSQFVQRALNCRDPPRFLA